MDVLIIDDEKNIRQLLKEIMELNHFNVDTAKMERMALNYFIKILIN